MSLTVSMGPFEGSSAYLEDVECCDGERVEALFEREGNDIFFDPSDIIFSIGDPVFLDTILDDLEPIENPHASSLSAQKSLDVSSFSCKAGMVPDGSESSIEQEKAAWLLNATFEPSSSMTVRGDESMKTSSDASLPISDSKEEDEVFSSLHGRSSIIPYCQNEELHASHTRIQRDASPSRAKMQRRIWGIGRISNRQISGRTGADHEKSYKPNGSCLNILPQKRLPSFGSTLPSEERKPNRHVEGYMQDDSSELRQRLGSAAHTCKAGFMEVAFLGQNFQSEYCGSTRLEHQDSESSDGMQGSLLEESVEKINSCRKRAMSRNLISERRRRFKLNEKLYSLRALVPMISKLDNASTVADAISYVKELKQQVDEMQLEVSNLAASKEALMNCAVTRSSQLLGRSVVPHHHQHQIVKFTVTQMKGGRYHVLLRCKRTRGVLVQLTQAIQTLEFRILCANFSALKDDILSTFIIKARKEEHESREDVHNKTLDCLIRFGFSYSSEEKELR